MGLTKQYLRFVPGSIFGVIASSTAKILFVHYGGKVDNFVAVPACENILIWNYRTGDCVQTLRGEKHSVTHFITDTTGKTLAVGYADGAVRIFNLFSGELIVLFSGHKSPVTALAYDDSNLRLVSGGKDTEIVLWDLVGENGLFRLKGHKGPITNCHILSSPNVLITSSEDTLIKFWNLDSQHCFKTVVGNHGEIWDFVLLNNRIITGSNDSYLKVWDVKFREGDDTSSNEVPALDQSDLNLHGDDEDLDLVEVGKILTTGEKKIVSLDIDQNATVLACHGSSKTLLLFKLLSPEESLKKSRRRRKKEQKSKEDSCPADSASTPVITLRDEIIRMKPIQTESKIVHFHIETKGNGFAKIAILLKDNSFEIHGLNLNASDSEAYLLHRVNSAGHRSTVNTLSFSPGSDMLLSASNESVRVWNQASQKCTHAFECQIVLSSVFVPGNNYVVVGTKAGHLLVFELSSHKMVEKVDAHDGPIVSIAASSDQLGIATGSGDMEVKFWDYELIEDKEFSSSKKRLSLLHVRTLKMTEEVQCVKFSPDKKFVAASLLDCTVKVFFCDTLKFAFSLYGHKLPIPCMDVSYDSSLLATGSKDKNIKIWSLEFGNCLKSIFAHDESIICLQFLPNTHMLFSAGNDKRVRQWDCDNFQRIITLEGHQSKIAAMAISHDGRTVVTASQDKSLRLWEKTDEPLVLEEEREVEQEKEMDKQLVANQPVIVGETNKEVALATKTTVEALKSAEQLIEAIDIHNSEVLKLEEHQLECMSAGKQLPPPMPHALLVAYQVTCPFQYMLKALKKIRSSNLEEILLYLPFNYATQLFKILSEFISRNWEVELCTRCILFLARIHLSQLTLCKDMYPLIEKLKGSLLERISDMKDTVGFNLAGLGFMQRQIESHEDVLLFQDASQKLRRKSRKRNLISFV